MFAWISTACGSKFKHNLVLPNYLSNLDHFFMMSSLAPAWFRRAIMGGSSTDCVTPPVVIIDPKPVFDPAALGLKEIGNLASWTVSSSKPGCGVEALRDEDTNLFWQ
jgi:hypothetical protein